MSTTAFQPYYTDTELESDYIIDCDRNNLKTTGQIIADLCIKIDELLEENEKLRHALEKRTEFTLNK